MADANALFSSDPEPCAFCGLRPGTKRCTRCKVAGYCSASCQKQHWSEHRKTCGKAPPSDRAPDAASGTPTPSCGAPEAASVAPAPAKPLTGGFFANTARSLTPSERVSEASDALKAAADAGKFADVVVALLNVLDELLRPECAAEWEEDARRNGVQERMIRWGCKLLNDCVKMRAGAIPPEEWANEQRSGELLLALAERVAVHHPSGRQLTCGPHRSLAEVRVKVQQDLAAVALLDTADAAAAPARDLEALRRRAELRQHLVGKVEEGQPTAEQQLRIDEMVADARLALLVAQQTGEAVPWDEVQVARYLLWTIEWRKLSAASCDEAREAFVLAQQVMAKQDEQSGHVSYDMATRISDTLVQRGFESELDGLE